MELILQLGLVVGIAAVLTLLAKLIKQPPLIAFLVTGIIAGPLFLGILETGEIFESFSHIAVAFLLFIVGISLDFRILKNFAKVSLVVGIGQIIITGILGFFIGAWLGFSLIHSVYIAAALAFSSTFIVVKLISDKRELESLHGKIALGILIVQDFIAALILTIVPVLSLQEFGSALILSQLAKVALLIFVVFLFSYFVIHGIFSIASRNEDVLFLFGIGWALLISLLFKYLGFSLEIGALVAGMSLASSKYSLMISSKTKGLRDFFVLLFFVFFGSFLAGPFDAKLIISAAVFSALVLAGNPLIIMALMKGLGYKKRVNFLTGISLAQISEFSLVLILLGFTAGLVSQQVLSLIILVALITFALSSYGIFYSHSLYRILSPVLGIFDSSGPERRIHKDREYHTILFGYNRIGYNLLEALDKSKKDYLVVDYNPDTINKLQKEGVPCIYGDAQDHEFLKELNLKEKKMVISTIPDLDINLVILRQVDLRNTAFIATAHFIEDAKKLYDSGADYVIMPHFLGGEQAGHMLVKAEFDKKKIAPIGDRHLKDLAKRTKAGHRHPTSDYHGD